jgi:hypothetical protein
MRSNQRAFIKVSAMEGQGPGQGMDLIGLAAKVMNL